MSALTLFAWALIACLLTVGMVVLVGAVVLAIGRGLRRLARLGR